MAFKYPGSSARKPIVPPPIPPSKLPQNIAPTPLSKGIQFTAFTLAAGLTAYAVLLYDFGEREHVFMPVRRWFDANTKSFFTLSETERRQVPSKTALPDRRTPIEFFKENPPALGKEADEKKV
ncbi:uncharacterized protein JCM6883_005549 [Sporobolomyces salmoneus]|uniref:uncharacterized protein n=1 Tax=Sporobolomyces salmoneus TaxID=183962 RepID=UPI003173743F